jgi:hypothetical protein
MTMIFHKPVLRAAALACAALAIIAVSPSYAAKKKSPPKPHITQPPDALFTKAEMENMSYEAFKAAYRKRGGDVTVSGLDNAAIYYSNIKAQIHDHAAKKISVDAMKKLQFIRAKTMMSDTAVFNAKWVPNTKPYQAHLWTRWCTVREDAIGGMIPALKKPGKAAESKQALLAKIEAFETRLKPRYHPFKDLAKAVSKMPDNVIALILKHTEHTANVVLTTKH